MLDRSDHYRKTGYWSDQLLTDFLRLAVRRSPQKLAVKDDRFGGLSYRQLVPVFVLALNYLGAVGVHMPITGGEHEFAGVLEVSDARGIAVPEVFRNKDFVALIDRAGAKSPRLAMRVVVGSERRNPGWSNYDELLARGPVDATEPEALASADDLTCLLHWDFPRVMHTVCAWRFTSGQP